MDLNATTSNADQPHLSSGIFDMFREGVVLVEAASRALFHVSDDLATMRGCLRDGVDHAQINATLASIRQHIGDAVVAGDNLLVADARRLRAGPMLVPALARDAAGTVTSRDIPIERATLAMIGEEGGPWPLQHFELAVDTSRRDPTRAAYVIPALEGLTAHVAAASSRLSIIKARLDLQSSFVAAVAGADVAPIMDSPIDMSDARALALQTRRLLNGQSLDIGNSNRRMLRALLTRQAG